MRAQSTFVSTAFIAVSAAAQGRLSSHSRLMVKIFHAQQQMMQEFPRARPVHVPSENWTHVREVNLHHRNLYDIDDSIALLDYELELRGFGLELCRFEFDLFNINIIRIVGRTVTGGRIEPSRLHPLQQTS